MIIKKLLTKLLAIGLITMSLASASSLPAFASTKTNTNSNIEASNIQQTILTDEKEIQEYAKKYNLPLESNGHKIKQIIINIDKKAENAIDNNKNNNSFSKIKNNDPLSENKSFLGDVCVINRPYHGYNTDRIAWETSGVGPMTISQTVSEEGSSEIFGEFSGKVEVVEAKVGFKIGQKVTRSSTCQVTIPDGKSERIVGYFMYKGYFVDYYTLGGLNYVGTYEVGQPVGITFLTYDE